MIGLNLDLIGAAELVEIIYVRRTQESLQRAEDIAERHAHPLGLGAVHVEKELGDTGAEGAVQPDESRLGIAVLAHLLRGLLQSAVAQPALVLQLQLEAARGPEPLDRRRHEDVGDALLDGAELSAQVLEDGALRALGSGAIVPVLQDDEEGGGVRRVRRIEHGITADRHPLGDARRVAEDVVHLPHHLARALLGGGVRELHARHQVPLILLG